MTRRGFLRRAVAGAAFVAGVNFATLVGRANPISWHDPPPDYFQLEVGVGMEGLASYNWCEYTKECPQGRWVAIEFSLKKLSVEQT